MAASTDENPGADTLAKAARPVVSATIIQKTSLPDVPQGFAGLPGGGSANLLLFLIYRPDISQITVNQLGLQYGASNNDVRTMSLASVIHRMTHESNCPPG